MMMVMMMMMILWIIIRSSFLLLKIYQYGDVAGQWISGLGPEW